MNKIFLIGLLALGYIGYKKYIFAKKVNINLKDFGFNGGTFLEPIINVKLEVENPTNTTTDLQKIKTLTPQQAGVALAKFDTQFESYINKKLSSPKFFQTPFSDAAMGKTKVKK